eukprot:TRINITY_DN826_c1_g1_i2.p1 TRINITY_DN826_c1_g1~~TRINITY_DN826_c1_g1_i2.p1  ORF type:complete len:468 (+),score=142.60 TRINITY_DN826_c1_g1_i2:67-1470(+)
MGALCAPAAKEPRPPPPSGGPPSAGADDAGGDDKEPGPAYKADSGSEPPPDGAEESPAAAGGAGRPIRVCDVAALPEGQSKVVRLGTRPIAVFCRQGAYYALDNACYHHGAPLAGGAIEELGGQLCVVCPWHGYYITLAEGEGLYMGLGSDMRTQELRSKGRKQRAHRALAADGAVWLHPQLDGAFESDTYADGSGATGIGSGGTMHSSRGGIERSGQVLRGGGGGRGRGGRRRSQPRQGRLRLVARRAACPSGKVVLFTFSARSSGGAPTPLSVLPGQYVDVAIRFTSPDPGSPPRAEMRRQWTVVARPGADRFSIAVKLKEGGAVSPWMHEHLGVDGDPQSAVAGAELHLAETGGSFGLLATPPPPGCCKALLAAVGVGVTPMYAMLRAAFDAAAAEHWQDHAAGDGRAMDYALLYGEREEGDLAFREELDRWAAQGSAQAPSLSVTYLLTRPGAGRTGPGGGGG